VVAPREEAAAPAVISGCASHPGNRWLNRDKFKGRAETFLLRFLTPLSTPVGTARQPMEAWLAVSEQVGMLHAKHFSVSSTPNRPLTGSP
jgi:hypothetical protein